MLRHLAVVRYDAFGDMGGHLSWSLELLDDAGNGVVLTSISFDERPPRTSSTRGSRILSRANSSPNSRRWFETSHCASGPGAS